MAKINIIFGSTGGNTNLVTQKIKLLLEVQGHQVQRLHAETSAVEDLTNSDVTLLASPTYGHGQLEAHMLKYWWPRVQEVDLSGQRCVVVGLGDDKYDSDYNVESAVILEDFVKKHGGELIIPALRINKNPIKQLEKKVDPWVDKLLKNLVRFS